jgi:enoyl-CoA hydratase/carnithine racemase
MDDLLLTQHEAIATLVLNRPAKHNALTLQMWRSLPRILRDLETNSTVRVLVVRGAGDEAFASGADISEFATVRADPASAHEYSATVAAAEHALANFRWPTIALIHGFCVGGGLEVALACDLRWASRTARFGITAARLGIVYSLLATRRLASIVGSSHARDLLYSGRLIGSEEAQAIGLVNEVCAPEALDAQTQDYARLLSQQAPLSQHGAKRMLQHLVGDVEMTESDLAALVDRSYESDDYREGVRAFLEKRRPHFHGR